LVEEHNLRVNGGESLFGLDLQGESLGHAFCHSNEDILYGGLSIAYNRQPVRQNKWLIPIGLTVLAFLFFGGGIAWALASGVAIPNPDATPVMRAHDRIHERIVSILMLAGCATFVLAVLSPILMKAFPLRIRRGFPIAPALEGQSSSISQGARGRSD
jgi:hypothetical protein